MPGIVWRYTTRRVLVTEWVDGRSPSQLLAAAEAELPSEADGADGAAVAAAAEARRQARRQVLSLVRMGVQCSLAQLLVTGVMHGDPHSGNLLLRKVGALGGGAAGWRRAGLGPALKRWCGMPADRPRAAASAAAAMRLTAQRSPSVPHPQHSLSCGLTPHPRRPTAGCATSTLGWWCASPPSTARP